MVRRRRIIIGLLELAPDAAAVDIANDLAERAFGAPIREKD